MFQHTLHLANMTGGSGPIVEMEKSVILQSNGKGPCG